MKALWELNDGAGQVGPLEEDHVIRMLSHGIPEHTVVRQVGEAEWRSPRTHAPFAIALAQRAASLTVVPQQPYPAPQPNPAPVYYPVPAPPQTVYLERAPRQRSPAISIVRIFGGLVFFFGLLGMIPGCLLGGPVGAVVLFVVMVVGWMMTKAEG